MIDSKALACDVIPPQGEDESWAKPARIVLESLIAGLDRSYSAQEYLDAMTETGAYSPQEVILEDVLAGFLDAFPLNTMLKRKEMATLRLLIEDHIVKLAMQGGQAALE